MLKLTECAGLTATRCAQDVSHSALTPENFIGLFLMMLVFIGLGTAWIVGEQLLLCCGTHQLGALGARKTRA